MKFFRRDERGAVASAAVVTLLSAVVGGGAAAAAVVTVVNTQGPKDSTAISDRRARTSSTPRRSSPTAADHTVCERASVIATGALRRATWSASRSQ